MWCGMPYAREQCEALPLRESPLKVVCGNSWVLKAALLGPSAQYSAAAFMAS